MEEGRAEGEGAILARRGALKGGRTRSSEGSTIDLTIGGEQETVAYPPVNIAIGEGEVRVTAEVPGVPIEELELLLAGTILTIKGIRRVGTDGAGDEQLKSERPFGPFARRIEIPFLVNADDVAAHCASGILSIILPRAGVDVPKRIPIRR